MITIRKSDERGRFDFGWLDTKHTFSFGHYHDPKHMGFRTLRVINEDKVAPGKGFGEHPHNDMEIISYVLEGRLAHRDSMGHVEELKVGDVQRMTAGIGVEHSEFNPSPTEPVHFLQIWIRPGARSQAPGYQQKHFPLDGAKGRLQLLASPAGEDGAISLNTDAGLYRAVLGAGDQVKHSVPAGRHAWVQVARGEATLNGQALKQGDGAAVSEEASLTLSSPSTAEVLVFDLP